jgi:hypothetical protein
MKTRFIPWKSLAVIALAAYISGSDKLLAEQQDSTVTALGKEFVSSTVNVKGRMLLLCARRNRATLGRAGLESCGCSGIR